MKTSYSLSRLSRIALTALLSFGAMTAIAQQSTTPSSQGSSRPEPSKETRAAMATAYTQMATCLRSNKEFSECRQEMQQACAKMSPQDCQMMRGGRPDKPGKGKMGPDQGKMQKPDDGRMQRPDQGNMQPDAD